MSTATERLNAALAGRYRVERELGTGGMATVYLAHDERHARNVALKVLRPELAAVIGADRFLNEIKTTANLQHPHILPLHDSGEVDGTVWYVMPLVEGESLRDRLNRETQLPVDDALQIAREVASALDYAHRHGVIHRDIKPENILLHDGRAVVADFGIALAMSRTDGGTRLTETGLSLGTPHYMSPEQAMGERNIDARTDVYALGAVLYEMLVGEPPFTGPTVQAIVAKVMNSVPPDIAAQRPTVPTGVIDAIMRALAKLPADRFKSAADFSAALQSGAASGFATASRAAASAAPIPTPVRRAAALIPWIVAAAAGIVAVLTSMQQRGATDARVTAAIVPLEIRTPTDVPLNEVGSPLAISSDGSFIVFVGTDPEAANTTALWIRHLDRLEATPIAGTRGAQSPRITQDGKTIRFFKRRADRVANERWEIAVDGGIPTKAPLTQGIERLRDGRTVFVVDSGLVLLASTEVKASPRADAIARTPYSVSPDAKWIARSFRAGQPDSIVLISVSGKGRYGIASGASPLFIDNDLLAFRAPDATLQVGRLKADRSGFVATPVAVISGVARSGGNSAIYTVADDGTLVYVPGSSAGESRLTWVRGGKDETIPNAEPRLLGGLALSPDGRRAAVSVGELVGLGDIWIVDLSLGSMTPLTNDGMSSRPSWRNDGRAVTYLHDIVGALPTSVGGGRAADSARRSLPRVSVRLVDRAVPGDSLRGPWPPASVDELVWSPDGRYYAMRTRNSVGIAGNPDRDVVVRRVDGDSIVAFATGSGSQRGPKFSPDGKWLLYVSDHSGSDEVYIESFPGGGNRLQISADGGREGVWSRDGMQVFYRAPDGWMMSAHLARGTPSQVTQRDRLFDASPYLTNQFMTMYDVAPDGRFLMLRLDDQKARTDVVIIRNWVQQVKARFAEAKK